MLVHCLMIDPQSCRMLAVDTRPPRRAFSQSTQRHRWRGATCHRFDQASDVRDIVFADEPSIAMPTLPPRVGEKDVNCIQPTGGHVANEQFSVATEHANVVELEADRAVGGLACELGRPFHADEFVSERRLASRSRNMPRPLRLPVRSVGSSGTTHHR